jgi:hypothetical protein
LRTRFSVRDKTQVNSLVDRAASSRWLATLRLTLMLLLPSVTQAQFIYRTNNNAITIVGYTGAGGGVDIPSTIDGLPVTQIAGYAFFRNINLTDVTIANSVTEVGEAAFSGCTSLTSVTVGSGVSRIGDFAFLNCNSMGAITVDAQNTFYSSVEGILFNKSQTLLVQCPEGKTGTYTIANSVAAIGNEAFAGCARLTEVMIPASVTNIGAQAFQNCDSLVAILVDGQNAFYSSVDGVLFNKSQTLLIRCPPRKAQSYAIPNKVTRIADFAFESCVILTNALIPNSVVHIGTNAFSASGLMSLTIPESVTSVGISAFSSCSNLTSAVIGENLTSIEEFTFRDCISLTNVIIVDGLKSIGFEAFSACSKLTAINVPDSVIDLQLYAFRSCNALTGVTIGSGTTNIDGSIFYDCGSLTTITVSAFNKVYRSIDGTLFDKAATTLLWCPPGQIGNYAIPGGVITIGVNAFFQTAKLTGLSIPDSIKNFDAGVFRDCNNLDAITVDVLNPSYSSVDGILFNKSQTALIAYPAGKAGNYVVPNNVTSLGDSAFERCFGLTNVTIPNSVTNIGARAFAFCVGLTNVTIPSGVTRIGSSAFASCASLTAAYFQGNAPFDNYDQFSDDSLATVYYLPGTTGWGTAYGEAATRLWDSGVSFNFSYTANNGNITISGFAPHTGTNFDVVIPDTINGLPVTGIGDSAFAFRTDLTNAIFGKNVVSIGPNAFYYCTGLTNVFIPESVTNLGLQVFQLCSSLTAIAVDSLNKAYSSRDGVLFDKNQNALIEYPIGKTGSYSIPEGVTNIEDYAFLACRNLSAVTIANSVTRIGDGVFRECTQLTDAALPNGVISLGNYAFYGCTTLTSMAVPNTVVTLGESVFGHCTGFTHVTIGNSVTNIGNYAFESCRNLTDISIPDSVINLGYNAFASCTGLTNVTIGNSVSTIGFDTFASCANLVNISIPDSVSVLGPRAFEFCVGLTNITIGNRVTTIGVSAFASCAKLSAIRIPDSVTSIGFGAFRFCSALTHITIGSGLTNSDASAFFGCSSLSAITVDVSNKVYSSIDGVFFDKRQTTLIQCPAATIGIYAIPNGVIKIAGSAFEACKSLTSVTIPDSVINIGTNAFGSCTGLTHATIGNRVTKIENRTFDFCPSLASVVIGSSVTNISDGAFLFCTNLTAAYFHGNAPHQDGREFSTDPRVIVYYLPGTTGWGKTFGGAPTALWNPQAGFLEVEGSQFGFRVTGPANTTIVVEAIANLSDSVWLPVSTNKLDVSGLSLFSDPESGGFPYRFYRFRSP